MRLLLTDVWTSVQNTKLPKKLKKRQNRENVREMDKTEINNGIYWISNADFKR